MNDQYLPTIKQREAEYPTALPVDPYPIAIPHTMATAIIKPFIAPVRLHTVPWGTCPTRTTSSTSSWSACLASRIQGEHIELLQILMHNFQKPEWVNPLFAAKTVDEFYDAFVKMEWTRR